MHELIWVGIGFCIAFGLACSVAVLRLGYLVDRFPDGKEERERSIWSPREATRLFVVVYWGLLVTGTYLLLQESRFFTVSGIAMLFGAVIFLLTAVLFSAAVLNLMKSRSALSVETPDTLKQPVTPVFHAVRKNRKKYGIRVPGVALDLLLKR
jgi:Na+-transporting methylmalonyl-CoA/oxaloacetate decarboxylase gamma subunit